MRYNTALKIAKQVKKKLQPYCLRIEIGGSVRRKMSEVKDIDIILIPKPYMTRNNSALIREINQWKKVSGNLPGKYTQRLHPEGIKIDIYFTTVDRWGLTLAVRTGPADFSHKVLGRRWKILGAESKGGYLYKKGKKLTFKEESDLFKFLELPRIKPEDRNAEAIKKYYKFEHDEKS